MRWLACINPGSTKRENEKNKGSSPPISANVTAKIVFASMKTNYPSEETVDPSKETLLHFIDSDIVGRDTVVPTPFGDRRILYADYTASGRALRCIEEYVQRKILPLYANTHTTSSATGSQSTRLREEARDIVLRCVGGMHDRDMAIFAGSGCTGALSRLVHLLSNSEEWRRCVAAGKPPLVLTGPYEHHSNLLPWRESGARVLTVRESPDGGVDLDHLESILRDNGKTSIKVGTFSAASNITGILSDTERIAVVLHRYKALAFFDYAAGAPYLDINMNAVLPDAGEDGQLAYKDAVFLSPHKFVGGISTPGVLVLKRDLDKRFGCGRPTIQPGGGTVLFVTEHDHVYLEKFEEREEGGTPDIVGAMRCGLAFRLKEAVGHTVIMSLERQHWTLLHTALAAHPNIQILGNPACPRLAIVSFLIRHGGKYLHHGFVATLLNDLFCIQVRAGCACAGPYAGRLLGTDANVSIGRAQMVALEGGDAAVKPGFVRLNANFFVSHGAVRFLADAVLFVAEHGWKLLPLYELTPGTSEWRHRSVRVSSQSAHTQSLPTRLSDLDYIASPDPTVTNQASDRVGHLPWPASSLLPSFDDVVKDGDAPAEESVRQSYLAAAHVLAECSRSAALADPDLQGQLEAEEAGWFLSREGRLLAWFAFPSETVSRLRSDASEAPPPPPAGHLPFACGLSECELEDLTRATESAPVDAGWGCGLFGRRIGTGRGGKLSDGASSESSDSSTPSRSWSWRSSKQPSVGA